MKLLVFSHFRFVSLFCCCYFWIENLR